MPSNGDRPVLQVIVSTQRRGAEVFATDLGEALMAADLRVRTVALVPSRHAAALDVDTLGSRPFSRETLRRLRAQSDRASVIIAHGSRTLPACALGSFLSPTPFIYRNIGDPTYWASSPTRRLRVALLLQRARGVAALWPGAARALVVRHRVPSSKIQVIPNGVPAARFPPVDATRRASARVTMGLHDDRPVVLYIGSLTQEKEVHLAIAAVGALAEAELLVVGEGPDRAGLGALAAEVAPGRVRFLGSLDDPASVLAGADVLVLPSRSEGMPGVLIEAGLSGLPVVATSVGGVAEVVVDGETGRLVPPGSLAELTSALGEVLASPGGLGQAARRRCLERFEIGPVAARWAAFLDEVTSGR